MFYFKIDSLKPSYDVQHDLINKTFEIDKEIPHEWYFINVLYKQEIKRNPKLATTFRMFVIQFYPDYKWRLFFKDDDLGTDICESSFHDF